MLRIALCYLFFAACLPVQATIFYVKPQSAGAQTGLSWDHALTDMFKARAMAQKGDEIWVAAGDYNLYNDTLLFTLKSGVKLYGGFAGHETAPAQRDLKNNRTRFFRKHEEYFNKIMACHNTDEQTLLDGVTIWQGVAYWPLWVDCQDTAFHFYCYGGGLYIYSLDPQHPTFLNVQNCTFEENTATYGGAVAIRFLNYGYGAVRMSHCLFRKNVGEGSGGALQILLAGTENTDILIDSCTFISNRSPNLAGAIEIANHNKAARIEIRHCVFEKNESMLFGAGTMLIENYPPISAGRYSTVVDACQFIGNLSGLNRFEPGRGGAILGFNHEIKNCLFVGNQAYAGGAINVEDIQVFNCLFYGNRAVKKGGAADLGDRALLVHNTFVDNYCIQRGGAFNLENTIPDTLINCAFWGNLAGEHGNFADAQFSGYVYADYCWVDAPDCTALQPSPGSGLSTCGPNMRWGSDPLLRDTTSRDFRPQDVSPLRDKGSLAWAQRFQLGLDLSGQPRFSDKGPDIGAFEALPTSSAPAVPNPATDPAFDLFPNPAATVSWLKLRQPPAQPCHLRVLDALGREYRQEPVETSWTQLYVNGWPNGVYTLCLEDHNGRLAVQRLVVAR